MELSVEQLKERKKIIGYFFNSFRKEHPWLIKREQAAAGFLLYLESDPAILKAINGLAASQTV